MIERIITASLRHRGLVLILTLGLVVVGIWSTQRIAIDAIPDLSDVQVVIRTEYPGQAPQVVEDQVTNPIATAMLAVPGARDVRGFSMFGSSFIYVLFADGTDFYWARTRVLEQLSTLQGRLPSGVSPQLGPDATGVGWIYQYVLTTGRYSPAHPHGLWHDPVEDRWYARPGDAPDDHNVRQRLRHKRLFATDDPRETCPLSGEALVESDIDLAELRSLQDWYLRYELVSWCFE
jgi:Cu(I)/Ag(I) efflux system membrane protein CusA/SilA